MGKKVVVMEDFTTPDGRMHVYDILAEKYGAEVKYVKVQKYIKDGDDFSKMFLNMEKNGPDVIPEEEELLEEIKDANIVISHISAISTKAVNSAKNLEAVCIMRSGVENVNVENAAKRGIKVVNAPGRLAVPVSEFTVGLMIAEMKNIARSHQRMQAGNFKDGFSNSEYSVNLKGKKIGLVGCGMVGSRVAKIMKAFEAEVLIYDPYMSDDAIRKMGYEPKELNELCKEADVISIHFRLTPETKGLIGKEQFALMKPGSYLINTARAGLVDEEAMMDALINKKIAGAGLDVFHQEPLEADNPLLKMDNVTITGHLAGHCADIFQMTTDIMMHALDHYFQTGEWIQVVNK
ncbi:2-hydroxyacid dehydrogenase [Mediterraneibacter sp. NSJ-55]|uniref:2-hydroxyacid dehydrogenase n=1 Tax=Mediterraneibacter hominis TaxID=2763054 RepID=A0A923LIN2_9FIRM|nr:2-hydroxyacid dehydrogenase [Mediterraneibacter hominis]MBC5689518.1 2-hydroxyacid dehydrogenase [Mediterraneibacter hominis]